jgi:dUTP pyrophosphatase
MQVKIKKITTDAKIPKYAKNGDAAMDIVATTKWYDEFGNVCYGTGLAFEIPEGYVGLIFPRSSISKTELSLANAVGVIDSGYRGEVTFKFKPTLVYRTEVSSISEDFDFIAYSYDSDEQDENSEYKVGDRVGQIMIIPIPTIEFVEVTELSESDRGSGGFGSTGA